MAQHSDYNIANQGFPAFRTDLNNVLSAINTLNSGTSRPASAVAGSLWLDTTTATSPILKYYDGADDITLATINHSANTVDFNDSALVLNYSKGTFTGNGSSTTITINSGRAVDNILVFVNGICLVPTDDYTISGTTLTFATAPVNLAEITVRYLPI